MPRPSAARLLAALALLGCSAEPSSEPTGIVRGPIAGGVLDSEHPEVVELLTEWSSNAVGLCTGTLIAPNLVVTARHCVARGGGENVLCGSSPFSTPVPGPSVHVTTAAMPTQSSVFYAGSSVSVPPDGNDTCGFDLALVTLQDNVLPDLARPAVPRIDRRAVSGEPYMALGFGVDDRGNSTAGRMRLDGLVVQCTDTRCAGFDIAATEFMGEEGVCVGDSGGPAMDLEGRVIGVLSRGSDPCGTPVYGAVAGFPDWVMATALAAAAAGGYPPPFWALSGSSDRPPGGAGDPCGAPEDCGDGTVCYYEFDPLEAVCTATCATTRECSSPTTCVSGFDVPGGGLCLTPEEPPADEPGPMKKRQRDDSCSILSPHPHPSSSPLVLALLALPPLARRKRRPT